jgi:hypothetical protein
MPLRSQTGERGGDYREYGTVVVVAVDVTTEVTERLVRVAS